ncbi:MAG: universal stress protein [Sphingomonas sp.]|nr:universal stress protein [Sphingomonas sp.]
MFKLLACIDASQYAQSVCDYSAWVATRLDASVELLHVIQRKDSMAARHDLSGALGLGARSSLMEELVSIEEAEAKVAREQGRALLAASGQRLRDAGVGQVTILHRHGGIVETIIEREADADLVVIGKRGASADFAKGHLGSKVERVVRQSVKPVLVANRAFKPVERAFIAFDGGQSARKAVSFVATSALFEGVEVHLVLVGSDDGKNRDSVRWASEVLGDRCKRAEIIGGDVDRALTADAQQIGADLLVMGAYGHTPLRTMIVGSTTTAMVSRLMLPVLLFR